MTPKEKIIRVSKGIENYATSYQIWEYFPDIFHLHQRSANDIDITTMTTPVDEPRRSWFLTTRSQIL